MPVWIVVAAVIGFRTTQRQRPAIHLLQAPAMPLPLEITPLKYSAARYGQSRSGTGITESVTDPLPDNDPRRWLA